MVAESYDEWDEYAEFWQEEEPSPSRFDVVQRVFAWVSAAAKGLLDVRFKRIATKDLLPIVYVVALFVAVVIPIALTVVAFQSSAAAGLIALVLAPVIALTLAATVRLVFELILSMARLAGKVVFLTEIASDIHKSMEELSEPMQQVSADLRSVQFWRFKDRRQAVAQRAARR